MNIPARLARIAILCIAYGLTALIIGLFLTQQQIQTADFSVLRFIIILLFFPIIGKYIFQLAVSPLYGIASKFGKRAHPATHEPKVSVLIPAWNEEVGIVNTVRSVLQSTYSNLEVIVINDGSTDATHERMLAFIASEPHAAARTRYIPIANGGKASALNAGLDAATGEIIITVDADCVMDSQAIGNFVKHFANPKVMSVAGNVIIGNREKTIGIVQQLEYVYGFYFKRADSLLNSIYIVGGAAAAYRRSIFDAVGTFDEDAITEDIEFSTRIQNAGHKIRYAPDAIVYTEGPSDMTGLLRQRLRWKYGRLVTFFKYRSLFFSTDSIHSKYLTLVVLPIALFAEVLLLLEIPMLVIFYSYTFYYHDYLPLIINMALLAGVIGFQIITDPKARQHLNLLYLAPIAWVLFYFIDYVEFRSIIGSIRKIASGKKVVWQKWNRSGVFGVQAAILPTK